MTILTQSDAEFARSQLDSGCNAMAQLLDGLLDSKGRVAEEVHAIRKLGKSLRGGFSLFQLKDAACEIQVIGRLLSGPRDAVSRLKTWRKLDWENEQAVSKAIFGLLDQHTHSAARRPPQETIEWCQERVGEARKALMELPVESLEKVTQTGAKRLQKKVRIRFSSLDSRHEEDFHDARKALKAFMGAAGFLPERAEHLDPKLAEIADLLGDENDLATLSDWLAEHGFTEKFAPGLWKLIKKNRRAMRKRVIADADDLFCGGSR